jgi:hypothetical protein
MWDANSAVSTIAEILRRYGIEPAPERGRKTSWKEFLAQHWGLIVAADFFSVEVWTWKGLKRFFVLFFIDLATRQVEIAGISSAVNGFWMSQVGRNATDAVDGILFGKRYLIHDRDPLFTADFQQMLGSVGVKSVKLPVVDDREATVNEEAPESYQLAALLAYFLFLDNLVLRLERGEAPASQWLGSGQWQLLLLFAILSVFCQLRYRSETIRSDFHSPGRKLIRCGFGFPDHTETY